MNNHKPKKDNGREDESIKSGELVNILKKS